MNLYLIFRNCLSILHPLAYLDPPLIGFSRFFPPPTIWTPCLLGTVEYQETKDQFRTIAICTLKVSFMLMILISKETMHTQSTKSEEMFFKFTN